MAQGVREEGEGYEENKTPTDNMDEKVDFHSSNGDPSACFMFIELICLMLFSIFNSVSDPDQETLIWIRVPKQNRDKLAYKSTKIIKI